MGMGYFNPCGQTCCRSLHKYKPCSCWCSSTRWQHCIHPLQLRYDVTQDNSTPGRLALETTRIQLVMQAIRFFTTQYNPRFSITHQQVKKIRKAIIATVRGQLRQGLARNNNYVLDCTTSCPLSTRGKVMDVYNHTYSFAIVRISGTHIQKRFTNF